LLLELREATLPEIWLTSLFSMTPPITLDDLTKTHPENSSINTTKICSFYLY